MPKPMHTPSTLWAKVRKGQPSECWPWTGWTNLGYGRVQIDGFTYYAHRVIYNLAYPGRITLEAPRRREDTGWLLHTCDNPICCNPNHLVVGTHQDNMTDKKTKGRSKIWRGSLETPNAKLNADDIRAIRETVRIRRETGIGPTNAELAAQYEISVPSVKSAVAGRTYKDVS